MLRRSFLKALAALPGIGRFVPAQPPSIHALVRKQFVENKASVVLLDKSRFRLLLNELDAADRFIVQINRNDLSEGIVLDGCSVVPVNLSRAGDDFMYCYGPIGSGPRRASDVA